MSDDERPVFTHTDLFMIAGALRHERAERIWKAGKRGHTPRGLAQLKRLEKIFTGLARAAEAERQRVNAAR